MSLIWVEYWRRSASFDLLAVVFLMCQRGGGVPLCCWGILLTQVNLLLPKTKGCFSALLCMSLQATSMGLFLLSCKRCPDILLSLMRLLSTHVPSFSRLLWEAMHASGISSAPYSFVRSIRDCLSNIISDIISVIVVLLFTKACGTGYFSFYLNTWACVFTYGYYIFVCLITQRHQMAPASLHWQKDSCYATNSEEIKSNSFQITIPYFTAAF